MSRIRPIPMGQQQMPAPLMGQMPRQDDSALMLARALQQRGTSTAPADSPLSGLARALQAPIGAWMEKRRMEQAGGERSQDLNALSGALQQAQQAVPWRNPDQDFRVAPGTTQMDVLTRALMQSDSPRMQERAVDMGMQQIMARDAFGQRVDDETSLARAMMPIEAQRAGMTAQAQAEAKEPFQERADQRRLERERQLARERAASGAVGGSARDRDIRYNYAIQAGASPEEAAAVAAGTAVSANTIAQIYSQMLSRQFLEPDEADDRMDAMFGSGWRRSMRGPQGAEPTGTGTAARITTADGIQGTFTSEFTDQGEPIYRTEDGRRFVPEPTGAQPGVGGMPPLGTERMGSTEEGRAVFRNPDGTGSSERTITIEVDGRHMNIPTIFGGREVDTDEAVEIMRRNNWTDPETGRPVQTFGTHDEALRAARARSDQLGQSSVEVRGGDRERPDLVAGWVEQYAERGESMEQAINRALEVARNRGLHVRRDQVVAELARRRDQREVR